MIKRYGTTWGYDFRPDGRNGPRLRKRGYKTRIEAANALRRAQRLEASGRRLSHLVHEWFKVHGVFLKDAKYRLSRTLAIAERLGDPHLDDLTPSDWLEYRADRLKTVSASTVNHEQRYLSAVLSHAVLSGKLGVNPLKGIKRIPVAEHELSYLTLEQCRIVLDECMASSNPHCYPVALLCLSTGARWREVEQLKASSVLPGKVVFQASTTKTARTRAVPVDQAILDEALSFANPGPGRLFDSCRDAFRSAYGRTGFNTPQQLTHILRHTFASHYVMAGGDILSLQRILGHTSVTVTMRYAHLSPSHLVSAVRLNPVIQLRGQDVVKVVDNVEN